MSQVAVHPAHRLGPGLVTGFLGSEQHHVTRDQKRVHVPSCPQQAQVGAKIVVFDLWH